MLLHHTAGDSADPLRVYGVAKSLELCEADNEVCRLQEELPQLRREMQAHMRYWQHLLERQQQLMEALLIAASTRRHATAAGLFDASCAAQCASVLGQNMQACGYSVSSPGAAQQPGRFLPTPAELLASPGALSGAVSVVLAAQHEAKAQLAKAVATFAPFADAGAGAAACAAAAEAVVDSEDDEAWVFSHMGVEEEGTESEAEQEPV